MNHSLIIFLALSDWESYSIYKGSGALNPWNSIGVIATALAGLGFAIRGVTILAQSMKSDSPASAMTGVFNLIGGVVIYIVLEALMQLTF